MQGFNQLPNRGANVHLKCRYEVFVNVRRNLDTLRNG